MKSAGRVSGGVLVAILLGFAPALSQTPVQRADALLDSAAGPDEPGVAAMVLLDGRPLWQGTRGLADLATAAPIGGDTPFYVASTGKMFTALAVLLLADRGRLELDEPLTRWHPELDWASGVTIRHLLGHTSGLPDHYDHFGADAALSNEDVLDWLRGLHGLEFPPGDGFAYSNSGYVLLSLIVDRLTKGTFAGFMEGELFRPLGMTDTRVADGRGEIPRRALGYARVDGGWEPRDYAGTTTGAGGVYTTLEDLARWDAGLGDLVADSLLERAMTPVVRADGRPTPAGYGWLAESYLPERGGVLGGRRYVLAMGDLRGFRAWYQRFREPRLTVIWLTNRGEIDIERIERLAEIFLAATDDAP